MAKVTVNAGICNFSAIINAVKNDDTDMVDVNIATGCPNFKNLTESTVEIDALAACFEKVGEGEIFELFRPTCPHSACPIPTAMVKAVEVAEGLALPKDVTIKVES